MKLLYESDDIKELERNRELFEARGIPVLIRAKIFNSPHKIFEEEKEFWIYLDSQFSDAQNLIIDESHIVKYPIDISSFNQHKRKFDKNFSKIAGNKLEKFFNYFAVCIAVCICLWITWIIFNA